MSGHKVTEAEVRAVEREVKHGSLSLAEENAKLRAALAVYADPKHWAIRRNGKTFEDCIWIGPGATDTVSDGPKTAREALT